MCQEATGKTRAVEELSPERKARTASALVGDLRWESLAEAMMACDLAREWRRRSTHGGESGWIAWRVAAAGVEEGDLLGLFQWLGVL